MSNYAIEAALAAARKEDLTQVPRNYVVQPPPPGPPWEELAELCIGEDEQVSEAEAERRLANNGFGSDGKQITNGATPVTATLLSQNRWRWADHRTRMLERWRPTPKPIVRSLYRPPVSTDSKEVRSLRGELRALRAAVAGTEGTLPVVHVRDGAALVRNGNRWELPLGDIDKIAPGEVVEVDEETAARVTATGVLHRITPDEASRLIAANAPL